MDIQRFPGHAGGDDPQQSSGDDRFPTLGDLLRERATNSGDRLFLAFETGEERTYGQVYRRACSIAKGLVALGVRKGDHVGLLMPNGAEMAAILFAAQLIGAVPVPLNARYRARELAHAVPHSRIRILFTVHSGHVDFVALLREAIAGLGDSPGMVTAPDLGTVVTCDEEPLASFVPLADLVGRGEAVGDGELDRIAAEVTPADVGLILYTSGTTAAPKACEITHQAFIQSWIAFADWLKLDETASLWSPGPMFHVSGTGPMVISLVSGAPALLMSHFDPTAAWRMIAHFRPALLFPSFPAVTAPLFQAAEYDRAASTYIKAVCNVAPPDTQRAIQAMLPEGTALISAFGMTEAVGSVATGRPEDPLEERLSGCGRPLPGIEVNIVDPERGTPCPAGEVGEIRFRGPSIFRGYYNDPAATAAAIDSDGWMASGDLGFVDHSGVIHYVGRIKDMLKVGGENVAPAEVEDVLSGHRAVGLVQVIGKPDSKYGEVPVAFVELRPGAVADPQELIEYCRDKLASFKVPREVRMIEDWPVSATKIQKFKLKELL